MENTTPGPNAFAPKKQQLEQRKVGLGDAHRSKQTSKLALSHVHPDGNAFAKNPELRRSAEERMKRDHVRASSDTTVTKLLHESSTSSDTSDLVFSDLVFSEKQEEERFRFVPANGLKSHPTKRAVLEHKRERNVIEMIKDGSPTPRAVRFPSSGNESFTALPAAPPNSPQQEASGNRPRSPKKKLLDRFGISVPNFKHSFSSTNTLTGPPTPTIVPPKAAQFFGTSPSTRSNSMKQSSARKADQFATAPARSTLLTSCYDKPAGPDSYEDDEFSDGRIRASPSHSAKEISQAPVPKKSSAVLGLSENGIAKYTTPKKSQGPRFRSNSAPPTPPAKNTPPRIINSTSEVFLGKSSLRPMSDGVEMPGKRLSKVTEAHSPIKKGNCLSKEHASLVTEVPRIRSTYGVVEQVDNTHDHFEPQVYSRSASTSGLLPGGLLPSTVYTPSIYPDAWDSERQSLPPMPKSSHGSLSSSSNRTSRGVTNESSESVTIFLSERIDTLSSSRTHAQALVADSEDMQSSFQNSRSVQSPQTTAIMWGGPVSGSTITPQSAFFPAHPSAMPTPLHPSTSSDGLLPEMKTVLDGLLVLYHRIDDAVGEMSSTVNRSYKDAAGLIYEKHGETLEVLEAFVTDTRSHLYVCEQNLVRVADQNHKLEKVLAEMLVSQQNMTQSIEIMLRNQENNRSELGMLRSAIVGLEKKLDDSQPSSPSTPQHPQPAIANAAMHPIFAYTSPHRGMPQPVMAYRSPNQNMPEHTVSYGSPNAHQHYRYQQRGRGGYQVGTGQQRGEPNIAEHPAYVGREEAHASGTASQRYARNMNSW